MAQIFRPWADTVLRVAMLALLILPVAAIAGAYAVMRSPYITGQDTVLTQPVPFSHQHHVGALGLDCRYCHANVEVSAKAMIPPTQVCMGCHAMVKTESARLAPVRASFESGKPVEWVHIHHLAGFVYFDHSAHLAAGVGCVSCHGRIDHMPVVRQDQPLTMGWCLDCHRDPAPHVRDPADITVMDFKPDLSKSGQVAVAKNGRTLNPPTHCSG